MNSKHFRLTVFTFLLLVSGFCDKRYLLSQTSNTQSGASSQNTTVLQPLPDHTGTGWNSAHNRWQLTAVDLQSQVDTVSPEVRALRNTFWQDNSIMLSDPVFTTDPKTGNVTHISLGGLASVSQRAPEDVPELGQPDEAGDSSVWVVATFEGFHVYAINPAQTMLYTEINLRVSKVIRTPDDLSISSGDLLDSMIPGGRAKTAQGMLVASHLTPAKYSLLPNHTYILHMHYLARYKMWEFSQSWDVTTGKVQPADEFESLRGAHGESKLKGMTVDEAVNYLQGALPKVMKH
jgi:hypothetical protein